MVAGNGQTIEALKQALAAAKSQSAQRHQNVKLSGIKGLDVGGLRQRRLDMPIERIGL